MKKNLIGIVAAGLALALAFTGCESGSDSPVKYATDLDNPVTKGSKFTYTVSPTEYTAIGAAATPTTITEDATKEGIAYIDPTDADTKKRGYKNVVFVNGVNNYNIKDGKFGGADLSKPARGDVVNTKSETIVLNSKDNTFEYSKTTTAYEVKELVAALSASLPTTETDGYVMFTLTSTLDTIEKLIGNDTTAGTLKKAAKDAATALNSAQDAWDALTPAERRTQTEAKSGTEYTALENAKKTKTAADEALAGAQYYKEGARYSIKSTKTVNGATTGSIRYVKSLDKQELVKSVDQAGGTAKVPASGSYKVVSGNYKDGSILITKYVSGDDTYEFNDDNDSYIKNGVHYASKISEDFPVANKETTASEKRKAGSNFQKAARTLNIANKTLTATAYVSSYLDGTMAGSPASLKNYKTFSYLLSSSYTTPKAAVDDYNTAANATAGSEGTEVETKVQPSSYSYVCQ